MIPVTICQDNCACTWNAQRILNAQINGHLTPYDQFYYVNQLVFAINGWCAWSKGLDGNSLAGYM
jgi:hypothetical protein